MNLNQSNPSAVECRQANEQRQGEQVVYSGRSTLPRQVDDGGARRLTIF